MLNLVLLGMNQNKLSGTDLISIQIIRRVENEKKILKNVFLTGVWA